jgi:glycerol-3-phosphate dehydrogenase
VSRLAGLDEKGFDVLVIGGGMAGAGVARDLALRGASVALFEKADFAAGTTSRSSKLIHGGLRYLELFDLRLVRESLRERETLGRLAPHLVRPLPFLIPIYRGSSRGLIKVRIGLRLYDWLTPGRSADGSRVIRPEAALALEPGIRAENLRGAGFYLDDLLLSPERLCLENILSACRHGARAFNYAEVEEVLTGPKGVEGLRIRDLLTDHVRAVRGQVIVNAAGPWVDRIRGLAGIRDRGAHLIRTTKGIHGLLPPLTAHAVYLPTRDERMIFVIPWREFSLVGTTDTDFDGNPDRVWATKEEVTYVLGEVRRVLPDPRVTATNVVYTYAGIRPLTHEEGKSPSRVSREHRVWAEGIGGRFLTITGAKLTCFRSLAEEVADLVMDRLGRRAPSRTARVTLDGADESARRVEVRAWMDVSGEVAATGLTRETLETLVETHGRNYSRVLDLARKLPGGYDRLCPGNREIVAQLHYAVAEELTVSLQDFLLRRTGIGTSPCRGLDCAEPIAARMGDLLGWNSRRRDAELSAYHDQVNQGHRFRQA